MKNKKTFLLRIAFLTLLVFIAQTALSQTQAAGAAPNATLVVTNNADTGSGSLRQTIADAAPGDTINFDVTLSGETITLSSELLIDKNLTITGNVPITISGGGVTRVFNVSAGPTTFNNLNIIGGYAQNFDCAYFLICGGGISVNDGVTTTINDSTISGNSAQYGGGIGNSGILIINNSTISNNSAVRGGGGIYNNYNGDLTLNDSTVSGNTVTATGNYNNAEGGGIGTLTYEGGLITRINNSTIINNSVSANGDYAYGRGGGIYSGSNLAITNSTISGNVASHYGGGIFNRSFASSTNNTLSNNLADYGGGLFQQGTSTGWYNNTITANRAITSGGGIISSGYEYDFTYTYLGNTLVAGNIIDGSTTADDIALFTLYGTTDSFSSGGHNLIGTIGSNITVFPGSGDQIGVGDPKLGSLADNGGETFTHALLPGSPAIDAGDNTTCITTDQRGIARHDGNGDATITCDVGAYEAGTMQCSVSSGSAYTFSGQSGVIVTVNSGTDLDCLYVDEVPANHPHATGSTDGQDLQTGKYWFVEAFQADGVTPAADFNVDLTLPYANASNTTRACKWLDGIGPGYGWNCADGVMPTSYSPGVSVTRQNITDLSQWAVGDNVGPTAVSLQRFSPQTPVLNYLLPGLFILLCLVLSITYLSIRKQEGTNHAENLQRELP